MLWLTTDPAVARDMGLDRMGESFARVQGCLVGHGAPGRAGVTATPEYQRLFAEGWPLKSVGYDESGTPISGLGHAVVRLERERVSESEFAPPPGFSRARFEEVAGARRR